jgi:hypothetical protein
MCFRPSATLSADKLIRKQGWCHPPVRKGSCIKTIVRFSSWLLALSVPFLVRADEVTDWNHILLQSLLTAKVSPLVAVRVSAIVQASVFDAVNGIERRYTPLHVAPAADRGASRRAAAVQAAYAALVKLFPAQKGSLDAQLAASLAGISSGAAAEHSMSIARGKQWGQTVADARRAPGVKQRAVHSRLQRNHNMGDVSSPLRSSDQTIACLFWNSTNANYFWNHIAVLLAGQRHTNLSENARLLALLNIGIADAAIACWDAKYHYVFWRPVTAIPLAGTDGNADTIADAGWMPLFETPSHPECPSGHSTVSGAAAAILSNYFGEQTILSTDSDVMTGVIRSFSSFGAALEEIKDARIFAGIHFRSACNDGQATGISVASYVRAHAFLPVNGNHNGQIQH